MPAALAPSLPCTLSRACLLPCLPASLSFAISLPPLLSVAHSSASLPALPAPASQDSFLEYINQLLMTGGCIVFIHCCNNCNNLLAVGCWTSICTPPHLSSLLFLGSRCLSKAFRHCTLFAVHFLPTVFLSFFLRRRNRRPHPQGRAGRVPQRCAAGNAAGVPRLVGGC